MITLKANLRFVSNETGGVVFDSDGDQLTCLDQMGARVWEGLVEGKQLNEIARELSYMCNVPNSIVMCDLEEYASQLGDAGLLCTHDGASQ